MVLKLKESEDIRSYLKSVKETDLFLNLNRTPIISDPLLGTTDEYGLIYSLNKQYQICEPFFELRTKNNTNKVLEKGKIESNVYPIQNDALKRLWAQIGHRLSFLNEREIPFEFYYPAKSKVDLEKILPQLPYSIKTELTLAEVMKYAKDNFIDYIRYDSAWRDDVKMPKEVRSLLETGTIHSA